MFQLNRNSILVSVLSFFAIVDGFLLSGISLIGRAGISLFYTKYTFLKTWWKGALIVFIVWIILFVIQSALNKKLIKKRVILINAACLLLAFSGLYFSYADFRNTLSHRWLGERFHLGVYLFWLGWIGISIYQLLNKKTIIDNYNGKEDLLP